MIRKFNIYILFILIFIHILSIFVYGGMIYNENGFLVSNIKNKHILINNILPINVKYIEDGNPINITTESDYFINGTRFSWNDIVIPPTDHDLYLNIYYNNLTYEVTLPFKNMKILTNFSVPNFLSITRGAKIVPAVTGVFKDGTTSEVSIYSTLESSDNKKASIHNYNVINFRSLGTYEVYCTMNVCTDLENNMWEKVTKTIEVEIK